MTKSEIELQTHNYDQRIRAIVTSMSKLKDDLDYATEHFILDMMRVEYESKITELNTEPEFIPDTLSQSHDGSPGDRKFRL